MTVATITRQSASTPAPGRRPAPISRPRSIAFVSGGRQHGPIRRLVSPSDVGEVIKPFVFLDHAAINPSQPPLFGIHPHSGIATVTVVLGGRIAYEDTTGKSGELIAGSVEWMNAGNGVWHDGHALTDEVARVFQLWIALPAAMENLPAQSQYIAPSDVPQVGPTRMVIGSLDGAASPIRAPAGINYFHVRLRDGESWRYTPPADHSVAWLAVDRGTLHASDTVGAGELAVFEESDDGFIEVRAEGDTSFVIGSAIKHPHPLVLGRYSVHTSAEALVRGEAEIRRIGRQLHAKGRL